MKGGMAVLGERDRVAEERVMRRNLGDPRAGGRSLAEDFMVYIGMWCIDRHAVTDRC